VFEMVGGVDGRTVVVYPTRERWPSPLSDTALLKHLTTLRSTLYYQTLERRLLSDCVSLVPFGAKTAASLLIINSVMAPLRPTITQTGPPSRGKITPSAHIYKYGENGHLVSLYSTIWIGWKQPTLPACNNFNPRLGSHCSMCRQMLSALSPIALITALSVLLGLRNRAADMTALNDAIDFELAR
jgi:hypothetical protein